MTDNKNNDVEVFKVVDLLTKDNYLIPIYQRDYAWGKEHIDQLIQDVWDYARENKEKEKQPYYIGTLVTHKRTEKEKHKGKYEVLDGQQRLTALYILVAALKSLGEGIENIKAENLNLHFEAREESQQTLKNLLEGNIEGKMLSIVEGFNFAKAYLNNKENEINLEKFKNYLLNNVTIVRTIVPPDTDLNHYFEIMNNRGEQLEKHEILKAQLLNAIINKKEDQKTEDDKKLVSKYAKVWDACSQMDSYVQMNFDSEDRKNLFGESWSSLCLEKISCIQKTGDNKRVEDNQNTIECILERKEGILKNNTDSSTSNEYERFESIINFPNFLLQVLKATEKESDKNISLDDKNLLKEFEKFKSHKDFAKEFIKNLLKYRFWFDKYIIKRETINEKENWSLQKLKKYESGQDYVKTFEDQNKNDNIKMIQSMFHFSNPSKPNKTWLSKVFEKCKDDISQSPEPEGFLKKLECISRELFTQENNLDNLHYYDNRPTNYTFNLLDYVIWKYKKGNKTKENLNVTNFSFKFRNSVEHFYPQNPQTGDKLEDEKLLHSFGNLALTTRGQNSRWSNFQPQNKVKEIGNIENQSLKFQLMVQAENWNGTTIKEHQNQMIELLEEYLNPSSDQNPSKIN